MVSILSILAVQIVFVLFVVQIENCVDAHAMMCTPRQRAAYHDKMRCGFVVDPKLRNNERQVYDYCPHCLNGGTVSAVRANLPSSGWKTYNPLKRISTLRRAGICGDPVTRVDHMIGGDFMPYSTVPVTAVWKSGSEVDFAVELDTNHNGYFQFHLCNLDDCRTPDIDEKCFANKKCYRLKRVPHNDCQNLDVNTEFECGPIDSKQQHRWYVPCRNTGHVGVHIVGGESGTMRYKLPDGVTCKHCVLQWYWATANSCNPPGMKEYFERYNYPFGKNCSSDGGAFGAFNPALETCGGQKVPEEFWSCADVQISEDGKSLGTIIARASPTPKPGAGSGDEDRVKKDPDGTIDEGKKEIEDDINDEKEKDEKDERKYEEDAEKGLCYLENAVCDATVPCCDTKQVCVHTLRSGTFTCRFWWALWQEVEDQEKKRGSN